MMTKDSDWLSWRSKGVGSSDAPAVMGVSPWMTAYQLWELKVGIRAQKSKGNWAMERGHRLEPKARAMYEVMTGTEMPPRNLEHPTLPFIRASLDGYDGRSIIEIKCPGAADQGMALMGEVPQKYLPQIQHQLFVTAAPYCDYVSFDEERVAIVRVLPHRAYIEELVTRLRLFWACVETRTPPSLETQPYLCPTDCIVPRASHGPW